MLWCSFFANVYLYFVRCTHTRTHIRVYKQYTRRRAEEKKQPLSYAAVEHNLFVCNATMGRPAFWILRPKFQFKHMFKKYFIRIPATFYRHLCSWSTPWFHIICYLLTVVFVSSRRIWTLSCNLLFQNRIFSQDVFFNTHHKPSLFPDAWCRFIIFSKWSHFSTRIRYWAVFPSDCKYIIAVCHFDGCYAMLSTT